MVKKTFRREILDKRRNLSEKDHENYSEIIIDKLISSDFYKNSKTIMTFISFGDEVNTHDFIKESIKRGKDILVPITFPLTKELKPSLVKSFDELEKGFYDILTPKKEHIRYINPEEIDLIVVPGVVFDRKGYRVGYGGGYYDRFLVNLPLVPKIALAFHLQMTDEVPKEDFDIPVDYIYTEKEIIECK